MTQNKIILAIVSVVVLAVVGYYAVSINKPNPQDPAPTSDQAKLDINVVCQGALAYMTFPDAQSAETFVAECKEGKHPEVIEQYKQQMGLGDGVAI